MTLGTEKFSSSYKLKSSNLISLKTVVSAYAIKPPDISSWAIFCIDEALTPFYVDASLATNRNKPLMTATKELAATTSLGWPLPKKSYRKDISIPPYFTIALQQSRDASNASASLIRQEHCPLLCTLSSSLTPFVNGESTS